MFQNCCEPVGQGGFHGDALPGGRVGEGELSGVEALARQTGDGLLCPVHRVPQQGVAQVGHMDTDLVGAARLQAAGQVGVAVPASTTRQWVTASRPSGVTAIRLRSVLCRPIGALTVPVSSRNVPTATP